MPQEELDTEKSGTPTGKEYLTDDLTVQAVEYLKDRANTRDEPFFLYFAHFSVHTPLQAKDDTIDYFDGKPQKGVNGQDNATYAAMVKHLDDSVGAIMQALQETGLSENTIVVFTSDNGGGEYTNPAATDNYPFKGGKACLYEGGVRVPLVFYQPGRFDTATWCDTPVKCVDFLPTFAELTDNADPNNIDGQSLCDLLANPNADTPERTFYWHYPYNVIVKHPDNGHPLTPHSAIRTGDFKLKLVDEAGNAIEGQVEIELAEHEFLFGGAMTYTLHLKQNPMMSAALRSAQEVAKDLFNIVTINCHWYDLQPAIDGPHDWDETDELIQWAKDNGFKIRGHTLIYLRTPIPAPRWLGDVESTEQWWELVDAHFKAVAERYGDDYLEMDVMNEPRYHKDFRAQYPWLPKLDDPETGRRYFEIAQEYFENTKLMQLDQWTLAADEENGERRAAMGIMQRMIDAGAEVDAIGTQGHFFPGRGNTSMREGNLQGGPDAFQMKEIDCGLNALAALNLPVHITEFDPPSRNRKIMDRYPNQPRLTDEESAAWQVNFYTLAFSKPHIKELTRWFLVDGCGGNSLDGGLVRMDGTKKPAYYALKKLIQETWHTKWSVVSADGTLELRGFYGKYEVKAPGYETQTVELFEDSFAEQQVPLKKVSQ